MIAGGVSEDTAQEETLLTLGVWAPCCRLALGFSHSVERDQHRLANASYLADMDSFTKERSPPELVREVPTFL